ncbi:hypothetical protein EAS61_14945 [Bradyrhizobium zhanjiangense]|uniref:Uncharacterized protein n=1 Tax=Bradyrhizobium zhanjiangense TaxID=1325107 RepID=A0A4Q0QQN7_9BRAD|nr:hypothetical protein EAS61_14945 [Bradyrhizobium zhanjiangense]
MLILRHCERKRSNPESLREKILDCFVARAPRNDVERAVCLNLDLVPPARLRRNAFCVAACPGHASVTGWRTLSAPIATRACRKS